MSEEKFFFNKRVTRFLRQNFDKKEYRKLRSVYLALCEISNDYEGYIIPNLSNKCVEYSGMSRKAVLETMFILRSLKLINYGEVKNSGWFLVIKDFE